MILAESDVLRIEQTDITELKPQEQSNLPVTWLKHGNGEIRVLSRFGDTIWEYPKSRFPAGSKSNERKFNFETIPSPFRTAMKVALVNYAKKNKRPSGASLSSLFNNSRLFFSFLHGVKVKDLSKVNQMHCANYVNYSKKLVSKKTGKPLSTGSLSHRFFAVETLHQMAEKTAYRFASPWPDSSASHLAGVTGKGKNEAKTLIIPDDAWKALFQAASVRLSQADRLFEMKEQVESIRAEWVFKGVTNKSISTLKISPFLKEAGYDGLKGFNSVYQEIQASAMIVILSLSGIRVHELCYIKPLAELGNKCWYATEDDDGEKTYWLASRSDKTGAGDTEWMIPELATKALDIAQRFAAPLKAMMTEQQDKRLRNEPHGSETNAMAHDQDKIFLGTTIGAGNKVEGLSNDAVSNRINKFAKAHGVDWHFTPHQFRRTFATYVARSEFGDLRYLRDHYKHWSLDMTGLYYRNEKKDAELCDSILTSIVDEKIEKVANWLDPDTMLSGGNAEQIRSFRGRHETLRTYKDRRAMAEGIVDTVHIRPSGCGAWCTADDGGCGGRGVIEATRCADCDGSVIDDKSLPRWQGLYKQQLELKEIKDIGVAVQVRIDRDIKRCEKVLTDLGVLGASENLPNAQEDLV